MFLKDIFKKRKPTHLIIFINYKNRVTWFYNLISKFTYSIKPYDDINKTIEDVRLFIKKHPNKLKAINITSYGTGRRLVEINGPDEKLYQLINELRPLMDINTNIMFTTCFSGVNFKKTVEISEFLDGMNVSSMYGSFGINNPVITCSCKKKFYSDEIVLTLKKSKRGILFDEQSLLDLFTRNKQDEINWETSGMAYEYNKIMLEKNICKIQKQPYTLFKSIMNYLFNIQE